MTQVASAEVTIAKGDTWDAYVAGRANAFISYNFGDAYPVPKVAGSMLQPGSGAEPNGLNAIYDTTDAMGMPDKTKQGKLKKMRVRSGYLPNILTLGVHKHFSPDLRMKAQVSLWGTIEPDSTRGSTNVLIASTNGGRDNGVTTDFREGYLELEGSWGQVMGGRFLSIVGRGMTEMDMLYLHGYGVGFPLIPVAFNVPTVGNLSLPGPTGGMAGFGVLGAGYNAGVMYTTPSLGGLGVSLGFFDAASYLQAGWAAMRYPRPELELFYDLKGPGVNVHVFASGGVQKVYQANTKFDNTVYAATFGARAEFGPIRVGGGAFMGKGAGIGYAFDDSPALSSPSSMRDVNEGIDPATGMPMITMLKSYEIRQTRGFVGMAQVALGPVDIGAGFGQTQILRTDADKTLMAIMTVSVPKTQTGVAASVVYHINESMHLGLDYMMGAFKWYGTESQTLNTVSGGVTVLF